MSEVSFGCSPGSKIRCCSRNCTGDRTCDRRDDGSDHGSRKPGENAAGIVRGVRTLTANIVLEMGYAAGLHREALIATAVVLFVFILLINLSVSLLNRRAQHE